MKFKEITLVNFMRYKGKNTIRFSTDDKMNVTAILGNNTVGKITIAQAFRWGLYGEIISTNYESKEKAVLPNKEVIAEMGNQGTGEVLVEITMSDKVDANEFEYKFVRRQSFKRPPTNPYSHDVVPVADAKLTMLISKNGVPTEKGIIDDKINDYRSGYVQSKINEFFPEKLSNYFFFDGERWNDKNNKTEDIKKSINTILGITSILKLKEHLKDGNGDYKSSVIQKLNKKIKPTSSESQTYQNRIEQLERSIQNEENVISQCEQDMVVAQKDIEEYEKILESNPSAEKEQQRLKNLKDRIEVNTRHRNGYFSSFIKEFSTADKLLVSELLPSVEKVLSQVDLEGKDIPGVTSDTIDWLLETGTCLCGEKLLPDHPHYQALLKLREEVYPNKIGGPAKNLRARLSEWQQSSSDLISSLHEKAEEFESYQTEIDKDTDEYNDLERRIDRTRNLEEVRKQYKRAKNNLANAQTKKGEAAGKINSYRQNIDSFRKQLELLEKQDAQNKPYYLAIEYAKAVYFRAAQDVDRAEKPTLRELNEIIAENFERMFNSKEKYACLEKDYKIHMYYRSMSGLSDIEEKNLSVGEMIAVNFTYIVSILELANRRRLSEKEKNSGAVRLPLVLDAPFSNLSNENIGLIAKKLPEFAEQVIIFMLDKDWEASGLKERALPEYCYRVSKEAAANNSTIVPNAGGEL